MMLFCSAQVEKSRLFEDKALKKNNNKECNKIRRESLILQYETEKTCYKQFPLF